MELVGQASSEYDYLRSTWTGEMLAQKLAELLERPIHASIVRRELPKLGLRWRRARLHHP